MLKSFNHIRLWTDLMKVCMNANIMMTQFFIYVTFKLLRSFAIFILRPSDLDLRSYGQFFPLFSLVLAVQNKF